MHPTGEFAGKFFVQASFPWLLLLWKVFIPWEYAYGSSSQTGSGDGVDIPAYSALIFDMQLYNIDNASSNSLEVEEE